MAVMVKDNVVARVTLKATEVDASGPKVTLLGSVMGGVVAGTVCEGVEKTSLSSIKTCDMTTSV